MRKILIVGQTPPPYGGQAIMIELLLKALNGNPDVFHVNMNFSKEMHMLGKFKFSKIVELFRVIFSIWRHKISNNPTVLYFPPVGAGKKMPFYRDVIILIFTKFLFSSIIFHFHASGLHELYFKLNPIEKFLFRLAYNNPDLSIIMSERGRQDPLFIKSKKIEIIPNGIETVEINRRKKNENKNLVYLLFVGLLCESKGLCTLLESCLILKDKGLKFKLNVLGQFESESFRESVFDFIYQNNLYGYIDFKGVLTGEAKYSEFENSDIFCFPSHFEHENFPLVLLEAMMFSLPIITTEWRGIPDIVKDSETGIICPVKSPIKVAEAINYLYENEELRFQLGREGRNIFLKHFTSNEFSKKMLAAVESLN